MKVNNLGQVYLQPQTKTLKAEQNEKQKTTLPQQNDFSPALMLSANLNKISFKATEEEFREQINQLAYDNPKKLRKIVNQAIAEAEAKKRQERIEADKVDTECEYGECYVPKHKQESRIIDKIHGDY